jgi:DHA2 family multidrug resistance protein
LQTVLEEGNKDDWFGSAFITRLSVISFVSLVAFIIRELTTSNPLVNLRLFKQRNFAFSTVSNVMLGFVLYGAVYLIPIYLSQSHGYSARQAGEVMAWIGLPQLIIIPFMPKLMARFDVRYILAFGFIVFAISCFMNVHLGPDDSGPQLLLPNLIRAVGQACVFPPISLIATAGIARKDSSSASSLFNMMRNLGGAIGIAVVQTNREKFHSAILTPQVSLLDPATQQRIAMMQRYFESRGIADPSAAREQAIIAIGHTVQTQSYYFAYGDAFGLLGFGMIAATIATFFLRKPAGAAAPGAH